MTRIFISIVMLLAPVLQAAAQEAPFRFETPADIRRASEWMGKPVSTPDGESLGHVRDIAFDRQTGRIGYVVVSIGSFLIEQSLIAVAPEALRSTDAGGLVLLVSPDALHDARRFADNRWPAQADVLAQAQDTYDKFDDAPAAGPAGSGAPPEDAGVALISSGHRTAILSGGERTISDPAEEEGAVYQAPVSAPTPQPRPRGEPPTKFDRLDTNGDGFLNRAEIASQITFRDSYAALDTDSNGFIDRDEFEALENERRNGR